MTVRARLAVGLGVSALALPAGCGATSPQAPLPEARKLDTSLSGISTACGLAYQSTALDPEARFQLGTLDAKAATQSRKLAGVYHRNPEWIYQGETVRTIVSQALSALNECGLHGARIPLLQALVGPHS